MEINPKEGKLASVWDLNPWSIVLLQDVHVCIHYQCHYSRFLIIRMLGCRHVFGSSGKNTLVTGVLLQEKESNSAV